MYDLRIFFVISVYIYTSLWWNWFIMWWIFLLSTCSIWKVFKQVLDYVSCLSFTFPGMQFFITYKVSILETDVHFCNTNRPPKTYIWPHDNARFNLKQTVDISNFDHQAFLLTYKVLEIDESVPWFPADFKSNNIRKKELYTTFDIFVLHFYQVAKNARISI